MTTLPGAGDSSTRGLTALHVRRCVRHTSREAAARCPTCSRFFCRECVVEHSGRVLCVDCLAREAAQQIVPKHRWARVRQTLSLVAAVTVAWVSFYGLGVLLLKIPPKFHEATIWKEANDRPDE